MNDNIIKMAQQGHSQSRIAQRLGLSLSALYDHIRRQPGMRDQLASIRQERLRDRPARIISLYRDALSPAEVSKALGISTGYINQIVNNSPELTVEVRQAQIGKKLAQEHELIDLISHYGHSKNSAIKKVGLSPRGVADREQKDAQLRARISQAQKKQRLFGGPFSVLLPSIKGMREQGYEETVIAATLGLTPGTLGRLLHEHYHPRREGIAPHERRLLHGPGGLLRQHPAPH